ncbi:MAG: nucleotide exchange factor GrpE [Balneolaceae bacterium]|nr:MAG: nucleotide exchange factor GrpE [Balneolaceae bacterium]
MSVKSKEKKAQAEEKEDIKQQEPVENETSDLDSLLEEQQKRIEELNQEIVNMKDAHLRKAAEMDNMRKRLQREREQIYRFAKEAAVEDFLPVSDDLVRTLDMMEKNNPDSPYLDGIKMILNKFDAVLEKNGVKRIDKAGVPFDVNIHDAMLIQKAEDDSIESGTVLHVVENGYIMGEKTLRHAKVIVSE